MEDSTLVVEARALTDRLQAAWGSSRSDTPSATRLVTVAQRAHYRQLRRTARCGDPLAGKWLSLIGTVAPHKRRAF